MTTNNGAINYTYDGVGNRLNRTSTVAAIPTTTSTVNANDQLGGDTYDSNGNTTSSAGKTYVYDFENRIKSVNSGQITFVYDGEGNRVSKTVGGVTTKFLVDTNNATGYAQVVEEIVGSNIQRVYVHAHSLISQTQLISDNWSTSFYGNDGHGSVRFLTDATGAITDTYTYDAFGALIASTGTTSNNDLYAGEQLDGNLGFYYLRARYLNPSFGRFWTTDEFAGDLMSPNTLHKYLYAAADPVNRLDPSGNMFFIASLVGTAGDLVQRDIAETSKLAALQAMKFMLIGLGVGVLGVTAAQIVQRIEVPIRAQHYTTYWGLAKIFSTPPFGEIKNPAPGGLNYYTFDLYINGRDAQRNLAVCRRLEVAVQLTLFIKSDQLTWPPAKVEPFKCLDGETQPGGGTQVSTSMPIPVLTRQPVFWPLF